MKIPVFPDSREVTMDDKPLFDDYFGKRQPELSAYTFTNIFAWREPHRTGISRLGDAIIVHYNHLQKRLCLEPMVDDPAAVIEEVLKSHGAETEFVRVAGSVARQFRNAPGFEVELSRDHSDYLYLTSDLAKLEGRKYDGKRNYIARVRSSVDYEYVELDPELAMEAHEFAREWCEQRDCHSVEGLKEEHCAVWQMLKHFDELGIVGGAIRIDGAIKAFDLGEALNDETLVCHVEKADAAISGLYQLVNNEFAIHEGRDFRYINREQDLGIPGLRKAKESYHPVRLVEAYRVSALQEAAPVADCRASECPTAEGMD